MLRHQITRMVAVLLAGVGLFMGSTLRAAAPTTAHVGTIYLIRHGNFIRYFVMKALALDTQAWLGLSVAHCSLTIIQVRPDGTCKVISVGDSGPHPSNMLSGLNSRAPDPQLVAP